MAVPHETVKDTMRHALSKAEVAPTHLAMNLETFDQLRTFIYEQTGITFQDNQKYLLESRLLPRLKERKLASYQDYYQYLRFDTYRDRELTTLYELITTNETYFYRDIPQLETFMKTIVPATMAANKDSKQLRIWSAACSTGDEPYTLSVMLLEHLPLASWSVEILATDISDAVLTQAQAGIYGAHTLRHVPNALKRKYFIEQKGQFALTATVKSRVKFMNLNLYDRSRLKLVRGIDVVFCRNCLIYFDDKAKHQIVTDLHAALKPGGYLVIGFSESLMNRGHLFRPVHAGRSVVYQKV
jgi:chemotaxis protein methyltransferase CheR